MKEKTTHVPANVNPYLGHKGCSIMFPIRHHIWTIVLLLLSHETTTTVSSYDFMFIVVNFLVITTCTSS